MRPPRALSLVAVVVSALLVAACANPAETANSVSARSRFACEAQGGAWIAESVTLDGITSRCVRPLVIGGPVA